MSRAHVQGYDSNPAQFERMGNPWMTQREAQELGNSPISKGKRKQNRKPRPCDLPYPKMREIARELTAEEKLAKQQRENLLLIRRLSKQARSQEIRETTEFPPKRPIVQAYMPPRDEELNPWDREAIASREAKLQRAAAKAREELARASEGKRAGWIAL